MARNPDEFVPLVEPLWIEHPNVDPYYLEDDEEEEGEEEYD